MKKVILTVAAVFAFGFANAQEEATDGGFSKGDIFITGAFSFDSEKTGDNKENSFEVAPSVGFFVTENIAVGARIGFLSSKEEDGTTEFKGTEFSFGAFGRYYFTPASKFSVFGELAAEYNTSKDENVTANTELKSNGFGVAVAPGVSYFFNKNFAIEAKWGFVSYNTEEPDFDGAESTDTFNFGLDLRDLSFGLIYKF